MTAKRPAWQTRWPTAVTLAAAGILTIGMSVGSTALGSAAFGSTTLGSTALGADSAPHPTPSLSPQPGPSTTPQPGRSSASATGHAPTRQRTSCTEAADGHLANCPRPVSRSKLPAGAKNKATVSQPVSDLATLVDTVPLAESLDDLQFRGVPRARFEAWCDALGVTTLKTAPKRWAP